MKFKILKYIEYAAFFCMVVFVILWLYKPDSGNWEAWFVLSSLVGFGIELCRRKSAANIESEKKRTSETTFDVRQASKAQEPNVTNSFLPKESIVDLVKNSGLDEIVDEVFVDSMPLFKTSQQQTWLVATTEKLYLVRDDEITRKAPSMIQWWISLRSVGNVNAYKSPSARNVIDIGPKSGLLYSKSLYGNTRAVEDKVKELVRVARNSA